MLSPGAIAARTAEIKDLLDSLRSSAKTSSSHARSAHTAKIIDLLASLRSSPGMKIETGRRSTWFWKKRCTVLDLFVQWGDRGVQPPRH
jgi:hypothetical protein